MKRPLVTSSGGWVLMLTLLAGCGSDRTDTDAGVRDEQLTAGQDRLEPDLPQPGSELARARQEATALAEQVATLEAERGQAQQELDGIRAARDRLALERDRLVARLGARRRQLKAMGEALRGSQARATELEGALEAARRARAKAEAEARELKRRLAANEAERGETRRALEVAPPEVER